MAGAWQSMACSYSMDAQACVSLSVLNTAQSSQPSAWTLTALVCSRCENLAPLSGIRGNFVTFVQFVGNNQTLPLCLGSVAGGCMPSRSRVHCWKNVEREGMGWEGWLA